MLIGAMFPATMICDFAADPWFNMSADEYLLRQADSCDSAVFIRIYTWQPGAITFGYNQSIDRAVKRDAIGDTPLIRRVTGGRALYHDPSELTYAVAFNQSGKLVELLGATIVATQALLAEVIADFLRTEGINSQFSRVESPRERDRVFFHSAPCFASAGRYELVSAAGKVAASAQRRIGGAVLQHGSIKVAGLTSHPALPLAASQGRRDSPSAMEDKSFRLRCETFANAFSAVTGIPVQVRDYQSHEADEIKNWANIVRKKPTERRDIFKHCPAQVSL